jgi:hypothetical protein
MLLWLTDIAYASLFHQDDNDDDSAQEDDVVISHLVKNIILHYKGFNPLS